MYALAGPLARRCAEEVYFRKWHANFKSKIVRFAACPGRSASPYEFRIFSRTFEFFRGTFYGHSYVLREKPTTVDFYIPFFLYHTRGRTDLSFIIFNYERN